MPTEYKTRYDRESDMLVIKREDTKIKKSITIGNLTIDFDSDGRVVGLQQLNASKVIQFSNEIDSPEELLREPEEASIETQFFEDGSMLLIATLHAEEDGEQVEGMLNTQTPVVTA